MDLDLLVVEECLQFLRPLRDEGVWDDEKMSSIRNRTLAHEDEFGYKRFVSKAGEHNPTTDGLR